MAKKGPKSNLWVNPETGKPIMGTDPKTGQPIGLVRDKDGRFRPQGYASPKFPKDPAKASFKFRQWLAKQGKLPVVEGAPLTHTEDDFGTEQEIRDYHRDYFKTYYRNLILTDPDKAALELDCPPLALLKNAEALLPPEPSLPLAECLTLWQNKRNKPTTQEWQEVRRSWERFTTLTKATTLEQVTEGGFEDWLDAVFQLYEDGGSPKTLRNTIGKVKTVLRYVQDKAAKDVPNCERILRFIRRIEFPPLNKLNPNPISVEDFHKLIDAAKGTVWEVMLPLMLNACFYPADIRRLPIEAVQGEFLVFPREKKNTVRVAVLWTRTQQLLQEHIGNRSTGPVFLSNHGVAFGRWGISDSFATLRENAGLPNVTANQIRDGAYTAAVSHPGTTEKECKILAGHNLPGDMDAYVLRNPNMVKTACEAIEVHYFGASKQRGNKRSQTR